MLDHKWVMLRNRKLVTVALLIIIFSVGIYAWVIIRKPDGVTTSSESSMPDTKTSNSTSPTAPGTIEPLVSVSDTYLPNFNDIRDVVTYKDAKWIAAFGTLARIKNTDYRFYSGKEGLPTVSLTDLIVYKDQLWVGGQGGIARYDSTKDIFKAYLENENNSQFYTDPFTNKLYLGTFQGFYEYDDQADNFIKNTKPGVPHNPYSVEFTDKYIVVTSPDPDPVAMFNKQTGEWSRPALAEYVLGYGAKLNLYLLTANSRVFLYGRHKDYTGCDSQGKAPASLFYELQGDAWVKNEELTNQFYNTDSVGVINNLEVNPKSITFYQNTTPCGGKDNYQTLKADFNSRTVSFSDKKVIDAPSRGFDASDAAKLYVAAGHALSKLSGLSPYRDIQAIDDSGNLYAASSQLIDYGVSQSAQQFSIIKPVTTGYDETIVVKPAEKFTLFETFVCKKDGKTTGRYIVAKDDSQMGAGLDGGDNLKANLYRINADNTTSVITSNVKDIISVLPESRSSVCVDNTLYWLDNSGYMYTFNFTNAKPIKLSQASPVEGPNISKSVVIDSNNNIWLYDSQNRKVFKYGSAEGKYAELNINTFRGDLVAGTSSDPDASKLVLATNNGLWFMTHKIDNNTRKWIIVVSSIEGKKLKTFEAGDQTTNLLTLNDDYILASKETGIFTINRKTFQIKDIDNKLLPFYKGLFNNTFLDDTKYNKIWVKNSSGFSISKDLLIKDQAD